MRAVIQRVREAFVTVENEVVGKIDSGICLLLGVHATDTEKQADWLVNKVCGLRIFSDPSGQMNCSLEEIKGSLLVVSQFTLYGDCRKGRRPSFAAAAKPEQAKELYDYFVIQAKQRVSRVETGVFQAKMQVALVNDGPVTFTIDTP